MESQTYIRHKVEKQFALLGGNKYVLGEGDFEVRPKWMTFHNRMDLLEGTQKTCSFYKKLFTLNPTYIVVGQYQERVFEVKFKFHPLSLFGHKRATITSPPSSTLQAAFNEPHLEISSTKSTVRVTIPDSKEIKEIMIYRKNRMIHDLYMLSGLENQEHRRTIFIAWAIVQEESKRSFPWFG
jgi:hypothetical protein